MLRKSRFYFLSSLSYIDFTINFINNFINISFHNILILICKFIKNYLINKTILKLYLYNYT